MFIIIIIIINIMTTRRDR